MYIVNELMIMFWTSKEMKLSCVYLLVLRLILLKISVSCAIWVCERCHELHDQIELVYDTVRTVPFGLLIFLRKVLVKTAIS